MTGIGLFLLYLGYAVGYWGLQAIQNKPQDPFVNYLFPHAGQTATQTSGGGSVSSPPPRTGQATPTGRTPANVRAKIKGQHL